MEKVGYIHGTGAALNCEIGFIPDYVEVWTVSGTMRYTSGFLGKVIVFTSGSSQIKNGNWIKTITNGAKAKIRQVIMDSGSWAGGDAAGWLICNAEDITGTIGSENAQVYTTEPGSAAAATNHLGVVLDVEYGADIDTELAAVTGNAGFLSYTGDDTTDPKEAKGFTMGSTISVNGVLLGFRATRSDPGLASPVLVNGVSSEATVW